MTRFSTESATRSRIASLFIAITLLIPLLLSGCGSNAVTIPVEGEWLIEGTYGDELWEITENAISYSSDYGSGMSTVYEADIVYVYTDGFNGGDTAIASNASAGSNGGFAVIQYAYVSPSGYDGDPDEGLYNVFRWQSNGGDADRRDFTQGYDASGSYFVNPMAAESGATNAAGFFYAASEGAELQN